MTSPVDGSARPASPFESRHGPCLPGMGLSRASGLPYRGMRTVASKGSPAKEFPCWGEEWARQGGVTDSPRYQDSRAFPKTFVGPQVSTWAMQDFLRLHSPLPIIPGARSGYQLPDWLGRTPKEAIYHHMRREEIQITIKEVIICSTVAGRGGISRACRFAVPHRRLPSRRATRVQAGNFI